MEEDGDTPVTAVHLFTADVRYLATVPVPAAGPLPVVVTWAGGIFRRDPTHPDTRHYYEPRGQALARV